jgi:probable HAF family extracellular repeat protein
MALTVLAFGSVAPAQAARFLGLGSLPGGSFNSHAYDVSANGSVVVGDSYLGSNFEAFRWTSDTGMVGLGDFPGGTSDSQAFGVSDDGSVVVGYGTSTSGAEAFRWTSDTGMVDLGNLPDGYSASHASDISADGTVIVGGGGSASGGEAFRWTAGSGVVRLGDLPGAPLSSEAQGVSADGSVIVGLGNYNGGEDQGEAFRWTSTGGMVGLGHLGGGSITAIARGVSADGSVVVGGNRQSFSGASEAFRWTQGGGMVELADLPGGVISEAYDVSADGSVIVGRGYTATNVDAAIWYGGAIQSIKDLLSQSLGTALDGWQLHTARAVSADGRTVVGSGTNPAGNSEAWLAYLTDDEQVFWFAETSRDWDSSLSWSGPFLPGPADQVYIQPKTSITVTGPGENRTVNYLEIGDEDGLGRVTLHLAGAANGDLRATGGAQIWHDSQLVLADGRTFSTQIVSNDGVIRGAGTLDAALINQVDGEVRAASGESLVVRGANHANHGKIEAIGGSLEFIGPVTNAVTTGLITGRSAMLRFQDGLTNNGAMMFSVGASDLTGDVANSSTGKIIVAGGGAVTFYDDVVQNGVLQVIKVGSTTSVAVFAGTFNGSGGSSGGGDIFFLGDLRPGNSPATVTLGNNIGFGPASVMHIELGGAASGTEYDQIHVTGALSLDGALNVELINGFMPTAGQSFDILDWGSVTGAFATINLPSLGTLQWDTSELLTTGVLSVALAFSADFDEDGDVDGDDLAQWQGDFGANAFSDADSDGDSDGEDFLEWQRQLGSGVPEASASAAVPEPAGTLLFLISAAFLASGSRRRVSD